MKTIFLSLFALYYFSSCVVQQPYYIPYQSGPVVLVNHRVRPGDTMSGIYRMYGVSTRFPYKPYRPNNVIYVGEVVTIVLP